MPVRPSYRSGFAPETGLPRYPELWRYCVGAWAPCLGPSGVTLKDLTHRKNHGTTANLNNVFANGIPALRYDGSAATTENATRLPKSTLFSGTAPISAFAFCRPDSVLGAGPRSITGKVNRTTNRNGWNLAFNGSNQLEVTCADGVGRDLITTSVTGLGDTWIACGFSFDGATVRTYVNGIAGSTGASARDITSTNFHGFIGAAHRTDTTVLEVFNGDIAFVAWWNRIVPLSEFVLLSDNPFAMLESEPRGYGKAAAAAAYKAYWARYNQLLGAGPR